MFTLSTEDTFNLTINHSGFQILNNVNMYLIKVRRCIKEYTDTVRMKH